MLLDQIIESKQRAIAKLNSGEMLLEEEQAVLEETANLKSKKVKIMANKQHESDVTTALQVMLDSFNVVECSRKDIRELRKMLSVLKNEKFPKKAKKQ